MSRQYLQIPYQYDRNAALARPVIRGGQETSPALEATNPRILEGLIGSHEGQSVLVTVEHKDTNHIYYNATLANIGTQLVPANITNTSTTPILMAPKDFEMSVVRFDVSAQNIPITICSIIPPTNLNPAAPSVLATTNLFVTLTTGGSDFTSNVQIFPQGSFVDQRFPAGAVFRFQTLLDDINAAFAASYALIPGPPAGSIAPQLIWNAENNLVDLYVDPSYMMQTAIPPYTLPTIVIYLSFSLYQYLLGFNVFLNGVNRTDHKDVRLNVLQTNAEVQAAVGSRTFLPYSLSHPGVPTTLLRVQQEAETDPIWNASRSLILTSNMLPARSEFVPVASQLQGSNSAASSTQTIISDFLIPENENVLKSRNTFQYIPTAEYRMVDLINDQPIYTIDISMNWTDFLGNVYPLLINPGTSFSVKILFRRKGVSD